MAQQHITSGRAPVTWSHLDQAVAKINENFAELYTAVESGILPGTSPIEPGSDIGTADQPQGTVFATAVNVQGYEISADSQGLVLPELTRLNNQQILTAGDGITFQAGTSSLIPVNSSITFTGSQGVEVELVNNSEIEIRGPILPQTVESVDLIVNSQTVNLGTGVVDIGFADSNSIQARLGPNNKVQFSTKQRTDIIVTTGVLPVGGQEHISVACPRSYALYKIQVDAAAWVRMYCSSFAAQQDTQRTINVDPRPGQGVIAEAVFDTIRSVVFTPAAIGFNDDASVSDLAHIVITNTGPVAASITATFTVLGLEF